MERIDTPSSATLYFCGYWEADAWRNTHCGDPASVTIIECHTQPAQCVYCAGCGTKIATGTACPFCRDDRPCPPRCWLLTSAAVDFAAAAKRRGVELTDRLVRSAVELAVADPGLHGEELADLVLADPVHRPHRQPKAARREA